MKKNRKNSSNLLILISDINLLNKMKNMKKNTIIKISSNLLIFVSLIFGYSISGLLLNHNYFWLFALIPSAIFIIWHFYNIIKYRSNE